MKTNSSNAINSQKKVTAKFILISILFIFFFTLKGVTQPEIVIKNPDGLNSLWSKIPDNGTVKDGEVELVGNTQRECAGLALKRFKRNINKLGLQKSIKDVVSGAFSTLGVVVPSGYAKYALVALKMIFKAMTADSPEEFEDQAVQEAIKQIGAAGISVKDSKALEKALKEAYKKIVEKLLKMPKKELYNKPFGDDFAPCKNGSVVISLDPPEPGDSDLRFKLSFQMDEECNCLYPDDAVSGGPLKLTKYNI